MTFAKFSDTSLSTSRPAQVRSRVETAGKEFDSFANMRAHTQKAIYFHQ